MDIFLAILNLILGSVVPQRSDSEKPQPKEGG